MIISKAPEKSEPVLADKEIIMAALNIKTMSFGSDYLKVLVLIITIIITYLIFVTGATGGARVNFFRYNAKNWQFTV